MFAAGRRPEAFHAKAEHIHGIFVTRGFEGFDGGSGIRVDWSREDVALHTKNSVADPDPESGIGKSQDPDPGSGSGMNNPDHIS
jgi:hypothetical protein